MTRFELIAKAFPLHAQRIAECAYQEGGDGMSAWLRRETEEVSAAALASVAFLWGGTDEGHEYWDRLTCNGGFA